jgi:hypothetical protein
MPAKTAPRTVRKAAAKTTSPQPAIKAAPASPGPSAPSLAPATPRKAKHSALVAQVQPVAAQPATSAAAVVKASHAKAKLVRDSFTMPQADFDLIASLKERALAFKRPAKKSELLRAGLQALAGLNDAALHAALDALVPLKAGRPKRAA